MYCKEGNYEESRTYAKGLLRISKELGNKGQEAEACDVLEKSYHEEGNYQGRSKHSKELLSISMKLGNRKEEAKSCDFLAKWSRKE